MPKFSKKAFFVAVLVAHIGIKSLCQIIKPNI
ncbi:hypothetical protein BpHYR1_034986 [Brachionus plicatilis]|uniref:Uncharacterized protein n=1 Tax=Brachionus plicatilis TaxID=10195 RepID=A0A3M7R3D1_BRAPC|nr:hypothetical protein BpHYR1_034986 [Brachionus plicatilis]